MKLINILLGMIVFSVVVSMFFLTAGDILYQNDIEGYEVFNDLGGRYEGFSNSLTDKDSTIRDMEDAAQAGEGVETDEPDVSALKGTLSAAKMTVNFYTNLEDITNMATSDINDDGEVFLHPTIVAGFKAAFLLIISIMVIHFMWRFKFEA